ncbi:MAG: DUF6760 family protein [Dehalococcoidia bacterium]
MAGGRCPFAGKPPGGRGLIRYDPQEVWQEVVYVAYHVHWDLDTVLDMEHDDRLRVVREIASLNQRAAEGYR